MIESRNGQAQPHGGTEDAVLVDRRRPGRTEVHPSLIPLLRNTAPVVPDEAPAMPVRDELGSCVGIARGLGLAGLAWAAVAVFVLF